MHPLKFTHDVTFTMAQYGSDTPSMHVLQHISHLPPLSIAANIDLFFDEHDVNITHFDHLDPNEGSRIQISRDDYLSVTQRARLQKLRTEDYDLPKIAIHVIEAIQRRFVIAASRINMAQDRTHDAVKAFNTVTERRVFVAPLPDINRGIPEFAGGLSIASMYCAIELLWMLYDGEITIMYRNRQRMLVPLLSLEQMVRTAMDNFTNPALWIPFHDLCISAAVGILITEHYTPAALQAMTPLQIAYVDSGVFGKHADIMAVHLLFTMHDLQDKVIKDIRYVDSLLHAITLDAPTVNYSQVADWIQRSYGTYCQNALSYQSGHMGTIVYGSDIVKDGFRGNIYFWYCYSAYIHWLSQDLTPTRLSSKHHRPSDLNYPVAVVRYTGWQNEIRLYLRRKHNTPVSVTFVNVVFATDVPANRVYVSIADYDGAGTSGLRRPYGDYDGDSMRDRAWCKPLDGQVEVPPKVATMLAKLGVGDAVCKLPATPYTPPRGKRKSRNGRY